MGVSSVCRSFIDHASAKRWRDAVITLNGLNMYEMLRCLHALDTTDIAEFRAALAAARGMVNEPRINYALTVVETKRLPAAAPGDLETTGQVRDARQYLARPRSILVEPIALADLPVFNTGVTSVNNTLMDSLFGAPRSTYSQQCQPIENASLRRRIATGNVGPFRATGLDSAIASLTRVMSSIATNQRLVYRVLGTAGMLCARNVRGSATSISNHSWGTAIDLTTDGVLDPRGDDNVQFGMHLIAPVFNAEGWFWGAGFSTEDGMHFEAGDALARRWVAP